MLKENFVFNTLEFRNVSFKYPNQTNYVLKNINIKFEDRNMIGIVGENGAGKSTFIKLLMRLYDPTEGEIFVNNINIRDINYTQYMKLFSPVFQDFKLFAFNIKDNISFGYESKDKNYINECIRKSGLERKIFGLPKGLETNVYRIFDSVGAEFSGGEAQKIALARALYKNSPIVILDEPSSAFDPKAEFELYNSFRKLTENKTTFFISHRLSNTKFCDKILVLKEGEIIEFGTHNELLNKKGMYSKLYNLQASQY